MTLTDSHPHLEQGTFALRVRTEPIPTDQTMHLSCAAATGDRDSLWESRREWMFDMIKRKGLENSNNKDFQFWQQHNHPIELSTVALLDQKLKYIHNNPVEEGFVESPEMWHFSSAKEYYGKGEGELELLFIQ